METLIVGLVLTAVSALGWLSYTHPHAYKIIGTAIMILVGGWSVQAIMWNYGIVRGHVISMRKYAEEQPDILMGTFVHSSIEADDRIKTINMYVLILLGAEAYLAFLFWFPVLIDQDKREQANQAQLSDAVRELQDIVKQYKPIQPTQNQENEKPKR